VDACLNCLKRELRRDRVIGSGEMIEKAG
jgi:hypothetical protein